MNSVAKTVLFWLVIVVSATLLWQVVRTGSRNAPSGQASEISYSRFLTQVTEGQVSSVTVSGNVVRGIDTKGSTFRVVVPSNQRAMMDALQQHGVEIWFREAQEQRRLN
jgi:ATP-dependent Zn protease